jgi:hypothetical protein
MTINRLLFLTLFSCSVVVGGYAQILNGGFELWEDSLVYNPNHESFIDSATQSFPLQWKHEFNDPTNAIGYYRTTAAASGQYAVVMYTWYSYQNSILIQEGLMGPLGPTHITGTYKYLHKDLFDEIPDSAFVTVEIYDLEGDTIGLAMGYLDTVNTYTSFSIPIEYSTTEIPFTYKLIINNSESWCSFGGPCNYLFIDDVKFEILNSTSSTEKNVLNIYPNPSHGLINFSSQITTCSIYSLQGQLLSTEKDCDSMNLPNKSGFYILMTTDNNGQSSAHKVLKI